MLLRLWRFIGELFMRFIYRPLAEHTASQRGRDRFDGRYREIGSPLIRGSAGRVTSNSTKSILLPKVLKTDNRISCSKEESKGRPEFQNLIEVSYVEGEFLSKSLHARNNTSTRPRAYFWFAAALLVALPFAGIKSHLQSHPFSDRSENLVVTDSRNIGNRAVGVDSRGKQALSGIVSPADVTSKASDKAILQQSEDLSKTNMLSRNSDRIISPVTDVTSNSDLKVGPVAGSEPVENHKASVDGRTNVSRPVDEADRSNPKSHRSSSASREGISLVSKNIVSSRNQKDRTYPARPVRSSSRAVPETVVNGVLGGLAGAVVGGPVGLIAGAAVGATAGKAIAHSWGLR